MKATVREKSPCQSRIGIDGRNLSLQQGTGVASYARVLMQSYQQIDLTPEVLLPKVPHRADRLLQDRYEAAMRLPRAFLPWRRARRLNDGMGSILLSHDIFRVAQVHFDLYGTPLRLKCEDPPRVMHWTYPLPVTMHGVPNLLTVHDLIPMLEPELTGIQGGRMERLIRAVAARSDYILTVSETVRTQLIQRLGIPAERVVNCYQAVEISNALLAASANAPLLCPPGSLLCFGTELRRKNTHRVVEAHAAAEVTTPLVIIGSGAVAPPGGKHVISVPWAPRIALIRAIREARAVLFPSLAEGFGLPIIEAMALGTPVMTSRGGATEEIAGNAALLVDPLDVRDMAAAIAALDSRPALREGLRAAGLQRAAFFSETAYVRRLRDFYRMAGLL